MAWPPQRLAMALQQRGLRANQARQVVNHVGKAIWHLGLDWAAATDGLGRQARAALLATAGDLPPMVVDRQLVDTDGTRKLLVRLADDQFIEAVIIPASDDSRTTLCVSSQVGCGRRCVFCETGRLGLSRNLSAAEITTQLLLAQRLWAQVAAGSPPISNVVFMGMGEPLDNLEAVANAVAVMTDDLAAGLAWRKVTVSTVGVAWKLPQFFASVRANLAVSLNAPDDRRRAQWMPINDRCDLAALKSAIVQHLPSGREVLIEYILFGGHNDALADADLLMQWLTGVPARVNLIIANPGPDPALGAPSRSSIWAFHKHLLDGGIRAMVRHPHGQQVGGACGQLAARPAPPPFGLPTTNGNPTIANP
ncbi:MAG: 23S rRNA (adenine(2503)-C(2))-methyltransferase RlmN [Myxococcales bacterium]|nr:23S rRNA (adenine(2503)-C(2))-methyltransferase RlmN [Myxococcales bacterium]